LTVSLDSLLVGVDIVDGKVFEDYRRWAINSGIIVRRLRDCSNDWLVVF